MKKIGLLCFIFLIISIIFPNFNTQQAILTQEEQAELTHMRKDVEEVDKQEIIAPFNDEGIRSYIVIDRDNGKVLLEKNAQIAYPIASLSKVASMYLILEAIDNHQLSLNEEIIVDDKIVDGISSNYELSNLILKKNTPYLVKDLLYAVMLKSANDATSALMWHIYGSEQKSVQAIRNQLEKWDLHTAQFYTVSGAPNMFIPQDMWYEHSSSEDENKMSAYDLAKMSKLIITEHPELLNITKTAEYVLENGDEEQEIENTSLLLPGKSYGRPNVEGLKTGFTEGAGRCFITVSKENGRNIIAVVLGVASDDNVFAHTTELLNYLNQYR